MHQPFKNFLLKSIPYLLAIAGGAVLYWLTADKIQSPDLRDLVNNIAASLLAIPLVFLLYDYSNYLISRQLTRAQNDNIHDKINNLLINITLLMRQMMGMRGTISLKTMNQMSGLTAGQISTRLKLRPSHIQMLTEYYRELDTLIYQSTGTNILSMVQLQSLSTLAREMLRMITVHRFHLNRRATAGHMEKIMRFIADWVDADASASMRFQQLLSDNNNNKAK